MAQEPAVYADIHLRGCDNPHIQGRTWESSPESNRPEPYLTLTVGRFTIYMEPTQARNIIGELQATLAKMEPTADELAGYAL